MKTSQNQNTLLSSRYMRGKRMIVNFVMKPSSLNIFCKTMLILAIKVKKDGNVNYAKPSLKLKAQWNNTLNQFMKEYEIKFVSYAERHLFVNLT